MGFGAGTKLDRDGSKLDLWEFRSKRLVLGGLESRVSIVPRIRLCRRATEAAVVAKGAAALVPRCGLSRAAPPQKKMDNPVGPMHQTPDATPPCSVVGGTSGCQYLPFNVHIHR